MFPCTEISSKSLSLQWQATNFDIPGPQKPERGHIRQHLPLHKTALLLPLDHLPPKTRLGNH